METTDYCSYELSKTLKAVGFDELCRHYYDIEDAPDGCYWEGGSLHKKNHNEDISKFSAPTLWQAQKWLREKCGIHIDVCIYSDYSTDADGEVCDKWDFWGFDLYVVAGGEKLTDDDGEHDSFEAALSAGIAAALEMITTPSPDSRP